jgi:DNA (cytosine-5)-methyltransferase 1
MGCGSKGGCCTQAVAVAQGFTYSGYSNQPAWMTGDRTDCLPASGHSDGSHQGVGVIAFKPGQGDTRATTVVAFTQNCRDEVRQINGDGQIAGALAADSGSHQTNYVAYAIDGGNQAASEEVHHSLRTGRDSGDAVAFKPSHHTRGKDGAPSNVTAPLSADADRGDQDTVVASCEVSSSLRANPGSGWRSNGTPVEGVVISPMAVRRLTPKECERLQGFPDGYTAVTYRGKPASDGPRYRALGNSMAVPVMAWMGQRIQMVEEAADGR